ncbi:MAG: YoaK family protein [Ginsengibacter sp.]
MKSNLHKSAIWFEIMLTLLACVAGSLDVISYYKLGHVFTANMTGNTILLGLSIGQGKVASSLHSLAALAGFFTGSIIGAYIIENTKKGWSHYITLSIAIETIIIFSLVVILFDEGDEFSSTILYISIVLSAIAMGIQSATIRHLNIPGIVTTFLTGTITSIGMSTVTGFRSGFRKKVKRELPQLPLPKNLEQRIELRVIVFWLTELQQ